MFRLDGLTALVTGAGAGIGASIATALAAQGARVVVNDIDADAARGTAERIAQPFVPDACGDVSDPLGAERIVRAANDATGGIDILVNNAAAPAPLTGFADIDPADWHVHLSALFATLSCSRAVLGSMAERRWGRIVTVSSIAGTMGVDQMVLYGTGKGGIHAFTAGLAKEVAAHGITVNAVAPGTVETPRQRARPADERERRMARIPLGRFAEPEEIAAAVVFLASREASYVTGETLLVDGGRP
jgi:NAD(P)-dependent dehydrogenase (short-subunit alcohol dehydrogenase family)